MLRAKKVTRGRQKIELRKIQDKDALYISFSKRRNGLFNKASDLSILCDADLAVLVFSPTGRPHAFGSPGVEPIADRFLSAGLISSAGSHVEQAYRRRTAQALNQEAAEAGRRVEAERARQGALGERLVAAAQGIEWIHDLAGTDFRELDLLQELLQELKSRAAAHVKKLQGGGGGAGSASASAVAATSPSLSASSHHAADAKPPVNAGGGFVMPHPQAMSYSESLLNPFEPVPPSLQEFKANHLADAIDFGDFIGMTNCI